MRLPPARGDNKRCEKSGGGRRAHTAAKVQQLRLGRNFERSDGSAALGGQLAARGLDGMPKATLHIPGPAYRTGRLKRLKKWRALRQVKARLWTGRFRPCTQDQEPEAPGS